MALEVVSLKSGLVVGGTWEKTNHETVELVGPINVDPLKITGPFKLELPPEGWMMMRREITEMLVQFGMIAREEAMPACMTEREED